MRLLQFFILWFIVSFTTAAPTSHQPKRSNSSGHTATKPHKPAPNGQAAHPSGHSHAVAIHPGHPKTHHSSSHVKSSSSTPAGHADQHGMHSPGHPESSSSSTTHASSHEKGALGFSGPIYRLGHSLKSVQGKNLRAGDWKTSPTNADHKTKDLKHGLSLDESLDNLKAKMNKVKKEGKPRNTSKDHYWYLDPKELENHEHFKDFKLVPDGQEKGTTHVTLAWNGPDIHHDALVDKINRLPWKPVPKEAPNTNKS